MMHMRARIFSMITACTMLTSLSCVPARGADRDVVPTAPGSEAVGSGVAQVGGVSYETLEGAMEAAAEAGEQGAVVVLLQDTQVSEPITIQQGESITLDMQGHTITVSEDFTGRVFVNNGTFTIQGGGTVDVTAAGSNGYGTVNNFGTLTVVDGTYRNPKESNASNFYNRTGGTARFEDAVIHGGGGCVATAIDTDTTITGGFYENATYPAIENRGDMLITGGTFRNTSCSGCDSRWGYTVRSGESSDTAYLEIRGGAEDSVQVTGVQGGLAVIGGTADIDIGRYETVACETHGDGRAYYAGYFTGESYKTATTIYGGSFTSCSKTAVLVGNGNPAPDSGAGKESTVVIHGGTFVGGDAAKTAITVNQTQHAIGGAKITGGSFSSDVSSHVDPSSRMEQDEATGNWVAAPIPKHEGVAEIDGKYYASLGDAIAAAGSGDTILVLKDIPDAVGIAVPSGKHFTLDFGGHTYTLTGPGAGSPSTQTNGFQLLRDSAITMKNGTIRIGENANNIKRIIQNYADLTLEDMQIYAENQVGGEDYALSFNNGNITFKGNTSVYTTAGDTIAFDVCYWEAGGYTGTGVTFAPDYTGTVNGVMMYDSTDAGKGSLTIQGNGTFGRIQVSGTSAENPGIVVSGGHFAQPVNPAYLDGSLNAQLVSASRPEAPYSYYTSLDAAIAAAQPGDEVAPVQTDPGASTYTVTLGYNDGSTGDVTCTAAENSAITLPVPTRPGYTFLGWYDGGTKVSSPYQVTGDVTLTAQWREVSTSTSTTKYLITVNQAAGGQVTTSPNRAGRGDTVTITVKPDSGYALDRLTVTGKNGGTIHLTRKDDSSYTFTMPGSQVTVQASFVKQENQASTLPFADVAQGDWYYDGVKYVYEKGLMKGTAEDAFSPLLTTSRAMILTILARHDGVDTAAGSNWYEAGAAWAVAQGVSDGANLEGQLTREQLVTMLWRYLGSPGAEGGLSAYPDGGSVSSWAAEAMAWAVENGVITGTGAGALNPQGTATRAEVAAILMRVLEG